MTLFPCRPLQGESNGSCRANYIRAVQLAREHDLSTYDALIIAAAQDAGCALTKPIDENRLPAKPSVALLDGPPQTRHRSLTPRALVANRSSIPVYKGN